MSAGAPRMYQTPEEMQPVIDAYFEDCDTRGKPYTVPGLAYFLGFATRFAINDYSEKPEFNHTISRAKMKIELQRNEALVNTESKNVRGLEFDLKNNFGWHEKQEHEHSGGIQGIRLVLGE